MARDKYVIEMDEYFSQERFSKCVDASGLDAVLSADEIGLIEDELNKCAESFEHAARNWFWIADETGRRMLFNLWDGQRIVLEKLEDMRSRGKSPQVVVIKSRQLGLSQFGCALASHQCFFKSNQKALIMSEDEDKTNKLWNNYILPIYRDLPWFLKPRSSSLSIKTGIILDTDAKKSSEMGLRSSITVTPASTTGYAGQGTALNFFHGSEFTSWPVFDDIIERGIEQALHERPGNVGILESTAKGAGTTTHSFWNRMNRLGENARWEPVFLPFFMDKTHVAAPSRGWRPGDKEEKRREGVKANWVQCDNKNCKKYFNRIWAMQDTAETKCRFCKTGTFKPYHITDEQLYWLSNKEANAKDDKNIKQEQAITAEEAFLVFGDKVFSDAAMDFAAWSVEQSKLMTPLKGDFDRNGVFHGYADGSGGVCHCSGCQVDHSKDNRFLTVWELPRAGAEYYIGADVSEGIGKDWSVFFVLRKGNGTPDVHVATYRDRSTSPFNLAYKLKPLGVWYNNAQIAIEYAGGGGTTADVLFNTLGYGNCYKRKNTTDHSRTSVAGGYHWQTTGATKPKIITFFDRWLKDELLLIRDADLVEEIKVFVKVEGSDVKKEAARQKGSDYHDDYLMAAMIALYTAHQQDFDEDGGLEPFKIDPTPDNQPYVVKCNSCLLTVGVSDPSKYRKCAKCGSMQMTANRNFNIKIQEPENPYRDLIDRNPQAWEGATYGPEFDEKPYSNYW